MPRRQTPLRTNRKKYHWQSPISKMYWKINRFFLSELRDDTKQPQTRAWGSEIRSLDPEHAKVLSISTTYTERADLWKELGRIRKKSSPWWYFCARSFCGQPHHNSDHHPQTTQPLAPNNQTFGVHTHKQLLKIIMPVNCTKLSYIQCMLSCREQNNEIFFHLLGPEMLLFLWLCTNNKRSKMHFPVISCVFG